MVLKALNYPDRGPHKESIQTPQGGLTGPRLNLKLQSTDLSKSMDKAQLW